MIAFKQHCFKNLGNITYIIIILMYYIIIKQRGMILLFCINILQIIQLA